MRAEVAAGIAHGLVTGSHVRRAHSEDEIIVNSSLVWLLTKKVPANEKKKYSANTASQAKGRHAFTLRTKYYTNVPHMHKKTECRGSSLYALEIHPPHPPSSTCYPSVAWASVRTRMCPRIGGIRPAVCATRTNECIRRRRKIRTFIRTHAYARTRRITFNGPRSNQIRSPSFSLDECPTWRQRERKVTAVQNTMSISARKQERKSAK